MLRSENTFFVKHVFMVVSCLPQTPVFTFTSVGEESIWNIDGELFPAHQLTAQVARGLVNIYARGPED